MFKEDTHTLTENLNDPHAWRIGSEGIPLLFGEILNKLPVG